MQKLLCAAAAGADLSPGPVMSVDDSLEQAAKAHQAWEFERAQELYESVLRTDPAHPDAHHNLGVLLAVQLLQPQQALPHFESALNSQPHNHQYWFSYIDALIRAGQPEFARSLLPVAEAQGLLQVSVNALRERLGAEAATTLVVAEAIEIDISLVAEAEPAHAEMQHLVEMFARGAYAAGERRARALVEVFPNSGFAWKALGTMLQPQGKKEEALEAKIRAANLLPRDAEAQCNLGRSYFELGQISQAIAALSASVQADPEYAEAHNNLGLAFNADRQIDAAHRCFLRSIALKPDFAEALNNLSGIFNAHGMVDDALDALRRAVAAKKDYRIAFHNLLFVLNYHPDKSAEEIYESYAEYERRFGEPHRVGWEGHGNSREEGRKLKVGYVSPDFRSHSCTFFMEPLLSHHDASAVEVYAYADLTREDAVTARYKQYVQHWVPTRGMADEALAARIRADGIDILVDLAGHTSGNRLGVFARKPAPVSLSWMGYGYTTGLRAIDYYLTDEASVPVGSEHLFSEEPWRLPDTGYAVYRPGAGMGEVSELPAIERGYITLGTLTRGVRVNHHTIRVWAQILKRIPNAQLVIDSGSYKDATVQEAAIVKFEAHGIDRGRLQIGCHSPPWDVLRGIDIGLDCFPHNSGTTLFETLYMGLPYVTLAGRASVGRIGSAILHALGEPGWIAHSEQEYVDKVVELASDVPALAHTRSTLREKMRNSRLMDEAGFTRKVEQAYQQMFQRWATDTQADFRAPTQPTTQPTTQSVTQVVAASTAMPRSTAKAVRKKGVRVLPMAQPPMPSEDEMRLVASLFETQDFVLGERAAGALTLKYPKHGFGWKALGTMLHRLGRSDEALSAKRRAAELMPRDAEAACNLGQSLQDAGHYAAAEMEMLRALALKGDYAEAHNNLGITYQKWGRIAEADTCFRAALALCPDHKWIFDNYLFTLNYHPDKSAEEIYESYAEYERRFGEPHRVGWEGHGNSREEGRKLKVGYVSPDFRSHSCTFFMEPLLSHHDASAVEVYAYADLTREDAVTARYKQYVQHWVPTRGMADEALAARIRADGIDILVDLAGHTSGNRLGVFARKPAPVSLSWMGYGYTTGLRAIDYYLTDEASVPVGSEHLFSEEPWRLPDTGYAVYRPGAGMGEVSELPAIERGYITLGTLTRGVRVNHHTIRVWAQILKRIPNAQLVIDSGSYKDATVQEAAIVKFEAHGIDRGRLQIGCHSPPWDVLRGIDIGLDCFPHNSGTTLFETLYMGLPYVTLAGRASVGRIGSAILHALGEPGWIAHSEQEYVDKVVELASDVPALAHTRSTLREKMRNSRLMDEAGFTRKVEQAYQQMFQRWATDTQAGEAQRVPAPEAMNALVALFNQGLFSDGEQAARQLTTRYPRHGYCWKLLGAMLQKQGKLDQALAAKRRAVQLLPDDVEALFNLALALEKHGSVSEAEATYRALLAANPQDAEATHNLGNTLLRQGRLSDAQICYREAIRIKPDFESPHVSLAGLLQQAGQLVEAESVWRSLLRIDRHSTDAWINLGRCLQQQGRRTEAEVSFRNAVDVGENTWLAFFKRGNYMAELGKLAEAEADYRSALAIDPNAIEVLNNLAANLKNQNRLLEAETIILQALAVSPQFTAAHTNHAIVMLMQGRLDEAVAHFQTSLALEPNETVTFGSLLFALNYHPDKSAEEIYESYAEYERRFGEPHRVGWEGHGNSREEGRKLKVGYVSPDFRSHSCTFFMEPLLSHHDASAVEVYAYADLTREDAVTARYKQYVQHWVPTRGMADEALAARIRADGIDILVDLAGHTSGNRLGVFARKPAPVSLSWMGYGYTTGLRAIDYYLTDEASVPVGSEHLFSEEPWRLPDTGYAVYRPGAGMGEVSELPAIERGYITLGTLTRGVRVNHHTIRVWAQILKRIPNAQLVIDSGSYKDATVQEAAIVKFEAHGIDRGRLQIGCHSPPWDVLRGIDIGLDCFPHNSGTTLFETLYMGLPYVTLAGRASVGRIGSAILHALGEPGWIAHSEQEYVDKVVELASDVPALAHTRSTLREKMRNSRLMDEAGFTRKVEQAYQQMFQRWREAQP